MSEFGPVPFNHPAIKQTDSSIDYVAMLALWERAPSTVGELGEVLGLESATLTPLLKRLEEGGLVTGRRDAIDERWWSQHRRQRPARTGQGRLGGHALQRAQ